MNDTSGAAGLRLPHSSRRRMGIPRYPLKTNQPRHHAPQNPDCGRRRSASRTPPCSWARTTGPPRPTPRTTKTPSVMHDAHITNRYYQEYAARIAEQNAAGVGGVPPCAGHPRRHRAGQHACKPTPTRPPRQLQPAPGRRQRARTATIVLRDATGRVVLERTQISF
ncbi:MAG: hypothetical protein WKG07_29040 [Hymenobacter sp.]